MLDPDEMIYDEEKNLTYYKKQIYLGDIRPQPNESPVAYVRRRHSGMHHPITLAPFGGTTTTNTLT